MPDETIVYQKGQGPPPEPKPPAPPADPNEPARQTPADQQAEADLLKSSGGNPLTQESD